MSRCPQRSQLGNGSIIFFSVSQWWLLHIPGFPKNSTFGLLLVQKALSVFLKEVFQGTSWDPGWTLGQETIRLNATRREADDPTCCK